MEKQQIKEIVLNRIADGKILRKAKNEGREKWWVGDKIIHVRFRTGPKKDGVKYSYHINPNTLTADFEVWICGNIDKYYLIPMREIIEIYNDPDAYMDYSQPNRRVSDIHTVSHIAKFATGGKQKDFSPYFCAKLNLSNETDPKLNKQDFSEKPVSIESDLKIVDFNSQMGGETPKAIDINLPDNPKRVSTTTYRILRDSKIARAVKHLHGYRCQICGYTIKLPNGNLYAEAHHIKPIGTPHEGPDVKGNIICVCPNHHAQLDYGAIPIEKTKLRFHPDHCVSDEFINYHNNIILGG